MQSVSIKRANLKGYVPIFATASKVAKTDTNVADKGCVKPEMTDSELLPIVKLLHAVYKQYKI